MKSIQILAALSLGFVTLAPASPSYAATMKECAAQWDKMKAANQTAGKTYKEFSKECMSGSGASSPAAAPAPATAVKPDDKMSPPKSTAKTDSKTTATPASGGRAAEVARERACAADWKSDKAANKVAAGMKWPQYWSDCDKRKKAAGM
ncbi:MAG: hypothetical protein JO205_01140 [Pseudolabrys sp.]|nr:hypothetical protein [Pseudolabrys sp.]MBV9259952.1 hypothetical protein [Pseudolabrys sp.]